MSLSGAGNEEMEDTSHITREIHTPTLKPRRNVSIRENSRSVIRANNEIFASVYNTRNDEEYVDHPHPHPHLHPYHRCPRGILIPISQLDTYRIASMEMSSIFLNGGLHNGWQFRVMGEMSMFDKFIDMNGFWRNARNLFELLGDLFRSLIVQQCIV